MRILTREQVITLHQKLLNQSGGGTGIRDLNILDSAIVQPKMSYDGQYLYPTLIDKVSALGFSLISNHPFIDGNKRIGHAVIEVTLLMNGYEITADVNEQEKVILAVASSTMDRIEFNNWLKQNIVTFSE